MKKHIYAYAFATLVWVSETLSGPYAHQDLMRRLNELLPKRALEAKIVEHQSWSGETVWTLIYRATKLECGERCN